MLAPTHGVCTHCRGPARPPFDVCFCCSQADRFLGQPPLPVLPLSVYRLGSPLHALLRGYKDAPVADARRRFARVLCRLLSSFLAVHAPCLRALPAARGDGLPAPGSDAPVATTVPARAARRADPLIPVAAEAWRVAAPPAEEPDSAEGAGWRSGLLVPVDGVTRSLEAPAPRFVVPAGRRHLVAGRAVVLLDDTMTTGASLHHAAAALRAAGARSVAAVVLGRVIRPEVSPSHSRYWRVASSQPFDATRCALGPCLRDREETLSGGPA